MQNNRQINELIQDVNVNSADPVNVKSTSAFNLKIFTQDQMGVAIGFFLLDVLSS